MESERNFRIKAEQQRAGTSLELKELQDRLEEAGGANAVQIELNKRREVTILPVLNFILHTYSGVSKKRSPLNKR